ncbi:TetR/AcrR family transcriptional regulator [Agrobacterium sp. a22-2]|uniref:TetR/AcrR family transcriptional regulator n=1 Tax=Agrobacterium sp. a22-2 TaxID=2283840 RepID=UPI001445D36B|nr:TetR/AcrR family transcriptional regulator [Agrobacterium sp. a22-2]NKN38806.1 TetR/AcrR family transcriptional regulator [Agrobacterium sp. a22-2]
MGRPREFDVDEALQTAMELFWRKGYEGTSLNDLTEGMGITKPSLYGYFGNKEELFRKALDRYERTKLCFLERALAEPKARAVAEKVLKGFADIQTDCSTPSGCMAVSGALAGGEAAAHVQKSLLESRQRPERLLTERFQRAADEGDLPKGQDPAELAQYIMTISQGTAVQAASGADRDALYRVIETSLKCWPKDTD